MQSDAIQWNGKRQARGSHEYPAVADIVGPGSHHVPPASWSAVPQFVPRDVTPELPAGGQKSIYLAKLVLGRVPQVSNVTGAVHHEPLPYRVTKTRQVGHQIGESVG